MNIFCKKLVIRFELLVRIRIRQIKADPDTNICTVRYLLHSKTDRPSGFSVPVWLGITRQLGLNRTHQHHKDELILFLFCLKNLHYFAVTHVCKSCLVCPRRGGGGDSSCPASCFVF